MPLAVPLRRVLTTLLTVAVAAVLVIALIAGAAWRWQERIVWQPPGPPYPAATTTTRVEYRASDGQPLFAYVVGAGVGAPPSAAGRDVLLVFHGNADLAVWQIPWAEEVARRTGYVVMVTEYRGYAGLPGAPTYTGSQLDARAAYAYARDVLGADPARIALFGHSLGSAVAAELASEVRPRVLVLQSPFTSARDMARLIVFRPALLAWGAIARVHFDTEARVRTLDSPVWVAHGQRDLVIPFRMGRRVHEAAKVKGEMLAAEGAGHNDVAEAVGADYWRWIERALRAPGGG